jgi:pimeloyl-ACP methyl ester carboxylesterase
MTPENAKVSQRLSGVIDDLKLADQRAPMATNVGSVRRRRGFSAEDYGDLATLSLVEDDGILRWVYQPSYTGGPRRRASRAARRVVGGAVVHEFSFRETPPNEILSTLEELDKNLTRNQGLRRYKNGKFEKADKPALAGRVLLLVHGTFSKSEMFLDELGATAEGKKMLGKAEAQYDAVLAFEHPTLSVSPWINALDLESALEHVTGSIDVICHSRGGLVVAWWLRNAKRRVDNVIFVGAPLEGTSLASPARLRAALQGLANVFKALEAGSALASTLVPFMGVVTGLAKIFGGVLQLGASTPLADAAVAIVPGLAGQSRVRNNAELVRLHHNGPWISKPTFYAVTSNFQPQDVDERWWQVWKLLRNPGDRIMNLGADAVFDEDNDLVVNTQSMTRFCETAMPNANVRHFKDSRTVHHCNYFSQPETAKFFLEKLNLR